MRLYWVGGATAGALLGALVPGSTDPTEPTDPTDPAAASAGAP